MKKNLTCFLALVLIVNTLLLIPLIIKIEYIENNNYFYPITIGCFYLLEILFSYKYHQKKINDILKITSSLWTVLLSFLAIWYYLTYNGDFDLVSFIKTLPANYYFTFLVMIFVYKLCQLFNEYYSSKNEKTKEAIYLLILRLKKINYDNSNAEIEIKKILKKIKSEIETTYKNSPNDEYTLTNNLVQLNGIKKIISNTKAELEKKHNNNKIKNKKINELYKKLIINLLEEKIKEQKIN
ncbi:TPA: hypothetical protein KEY68_000176 [Providencia rettgeri]|uniref:hypothetical protein n=1 Tax=Providencia sp. PROV141 TaxID=2949851 RepID=UPI001B996DFA|nr:hypothetical protein [Providencia sp. PROV141]HBC7427954.1 hypothetical protein [Providencia rettgeri]